MRRRSPRRWLLLLHRRDKAIATPTHRPNVLLRLPIISQRLPHRHMVGALYPEELRPLVLSTISGVWGAAALYGPMVGGVFAEFGWWRGAFWVDVPMILVVIALIWRALPSDT